MKKLVLAGATAAFVALAPACGNGVPHLGTTNAKSSAPAQAPAATVVPPSDSFDSDFRSVDADLGNVDGQLKQAGSDLSSTGEGDVQQ